jgi:hypothetical protein
LPCCGNGSCVFAWGKTLQAWNESTSACKELTNEAVPKFPIEPPSSIIKRCRYVIERCRSAVERRRSVTERCRSVIECRRSAMSLRGFVLKHCTSAPSWNQTWSFGTGSNRKVFSKPHLGAFFAPQKTQAYRDSVLSRSGPGCVVAAWPPEVARSLTVAM